MNSARYVIITPVRDEQEYLEQTIDSVAAQTIRPSEWIVVDDGSTDATGRILREAAAKHAWLRPFQRSNRGVRIAGGGVIEAFDDGLLCIRDPGWEYLVKMDGDLSFGVDYF